MSNGAPTGSSSWPAILAAVIALVNVAFTGYVNHNVETGKKDIQLQLAEGQKRIEQRTAVVALQNETYLKDRLPKLQKEIETYLTFALQAAEGRFKGKAAYSKADELRLKVLLLIAACEPRPDDQRLNKASLALETAVKDLRRSVVDDKITEESTSRIDAVLAGWKNFQAEVYRVATTGYDAPAVASASSSPAR